MALKRFISLIITVLLTQTALCQLRFEKESLDLGTFEELGGKRTCTFEATNIGKKTILILDVVTTCGCTVPTFSRRPIKPGERTQIEVSYDPLGRPGTFDRKLHVYGSNRERLGVLTIHGMVTPRERSIEELYPIEVGEGVRLNTTHCTFTYIYVGRSISSAISLVNHSDKRHTIALQPRQESGLLKVDVPATLQAGERSAINFSYEIPASKPRYGSISDVLEVWVDGVKSEKVILVHGVAIDPPNKALKDRAPKVEVSEIIVKFGTVKHSEAPHTRRLTLRNAGSSELILQAAECRAPFACRFPVGVRLKAGEELEGEITLSPHEGEYGFLSGQLLLVTNDPERPARRIRINATVED